MLHQFSLASIGFCHWLRSSACIDELSVNLSLSSASRLCCGCFYKHHEAWCILLSAVCLSICHIVEYCIERLFSPPSSPSLEFFGTKHCSKIPLASHSIAKYWYMCGMKTHDFPPITCSISVFPETVQDSDIGSHILHNMIYQTWCRLSFRGSLYSWKPLQGQLGH